MSIKRLAFYVTLSALISTYLGSFTGTFYQVQTATVAVIELAWIPTQDVVDCVSAYDYLVEHSNKTSETNTEEETDMVRKYYSVLQAVLAVADIEKMYIPPQADMQEGVYGNQILLEQQMVEALNVSSNSTLLDMGCGRGRVSHHVSQLTGGKVHGFNIDERQIVHANLYAAKTGMANRLSFKVGDFQKRFLYQDNTFDGSYDMQAIWVSRRNAISILHHEKFTVH